MSRLCPSSLCSAMIVLSVSCTGLIDGAADDEAALDGGGADGPGTIDALAPADAGAVSGFDAAYLGACPGTAPVVFDALATPWMEPLPEDAYRVFDLPVPADGHYGKVTIDFDMDVTVPPSDITALWILRNKAVPNTSPYHNWFGGSLTRNGKIVLYVNNYSGPEDDGQWVAIPWRFSNHTTYHAHYVYDAAEGGVSLRYDGDDGTTITLEAVAHASIARAGQGVKFEIGIPTTHADYGPVLPPAGWTFRNLTIRFEPGGPFGAAPPCP